MSSRATWIFSAVVFVPFILFGAFQTEKPLAFIVIVGLLAFFVTGAGVNLGELKETVRENEARESRRALDRDIALDAMRTEGIDTDERL